MATASRASTLGELRTSGWRSRTVKEELRANLIGRLASGGDVLPVLEQLHVHLEADGLDVPALLAAEQVAGAANLEVERRDAEAAAEIAELLDRRQPLLARPATGCPPAESAGTRRPGDPIGRRGRAAGRAATGRSDRRG